MFADEQKPLGIDIAPENTDANAETEIGTSKDNPDVSIKSPSKKSTLSCEQCGKKFFKLHRLEGHLRQHQGLKVRLSSETDQTIGFKIRIDCVTAFSRASVKYVVKRSVSGPDWLCIWMVGTMTKRTKNHSPAMLIIVTRWITVWWCGYGKN